MGEGRQPSYRSMFGDATKHIGEHDTPFDWRNRGIEAKFPAATPHECVQAAEITAPIVSSPIKSVS